MGQDLLAPPAGQQPCHRLVDLPPPPVVQGHEPLEPGRHFLAGRPEQLGDLAEHLLDDGDERQVDLAEGTVRDLTNGSVLIFGKIPEVMRRILDEGGIMPYLEKHGDIKL